MKNKKTNAPLAANPRDAENQNETMKLDNVKYQNCIITGLKLLLSAFFLISCTHNPNIESDPAIRIDFFDKNYKNFSFSTVRIVPLQTTDLNIYGNHIKIKLTDSNIFISDQDYGSVFRYGNDGQFIERTGTRGPGPHEYPNLVDYTVLNDTVEILSVTGQNSVINGYSFDGSLLYSRKFELNVVGFDKNHEGYLLYTSFQHALHPWRLYSANFAGEITQNFLQSVPDLNIPMTEQNFYSNDSQIIFKEVFNNRIYSYSSGELSEMFVIDFGKYAVPDNFFKTDFSKGFEKLNQNGFAIIRSIFDNSSFTAFEVLTQKYGVENQLYNLLFDKNNHNFFRIHYGDAEEAMFEQLIGISAHNELVYLSYPHQLLNKQHLLKQLPIENFEIFDKLKESDNPVLFFCKLSAR